MTHPHSAPARAAAFLIALGGLMTNDAVPARAAAAPAPAPVERIVAAALADSSAFALLADLCDTAGSRLNGSEGQRRAVAWALDRLRAGGLDGVRAEPLTVPHWVRGRESCTLLEPYEQPLTLLGLGGSVGTPPGGITAEVLAVRDFDELEARAAEAAGRLVLFDPPWEGYGKTVQYRGRGAVAAARHGAVGCLIRSVTDRSLATPHTGIMRYDKGDTIPRIPAAALSVEDAALLTRLARRGPVRVRLEMGAAQLPDAPSANVVANLTGRELPDEIVLAGAHLDSWDAGCGAHDDGAGCAIVMEAVLLLKRLDLAPRRTLRVVLFADEEMTQQGGRGYARDHAGELPRHRAALECDSGGFAPAGFTVQADSATVARFAALAAPLAPLGADAVTPGGGGVDISFLADAGVPLIGHRVHGEHYFDVHHSPADTLDKVDPADLQRNVAAVAALLWLIAEAP
ncbi:MAG: M20/M25/M40 family metallo-hydrolase [bacterium]|nr:M20/M25/M40 family metallo-hydrolase [bacterium]